VTDRKGLIVATTRTAHTVWEGELLKGTGTVTFDSSGIGSQPVSWPSRAEQANGKTSPEELIAAAHSSCFSMALSHGLTGAGTPPTRLETKADVTSSPSAARSPASTRPASRRRPRAQRRTARSARP
jgi:osmotically inducible protein OsmC